MKYYLLLLPLALAACTPTSPTDTPAAPATSATAPATSSASASVTAADNATLARYHWRLESASDGAGKRIDALFANQDKPLQLDFDDGRLFVSNTCNHIGGSYNIVGGRLRAGSWAQTMMACADPALMALDKAATHYLQGNPVMHLQAGTDTPRLTLVEDDGSTLAFVGAPTAETRYGSKGETVFMEVAAQTVPCDDPPVPGKSCLSVRERHYDANGLKAGAPGEWHPLQQDIEGYAHKPGVRNVLRLKRFKLADAPANAASVAYVLDMTVESEVVKP